MVVLGDFPPELILYIASVSTRETILDLDEDQSKLHVVPDLPSINALSQTSVNFHHTLNQTLYALCASVEVLGKLALLYTVEHGTERTLDRLVAAGISLETEFSSRGCWSPCSLLHISAAKGNRAMVVKLLEMYGEERSARVHVREGINKTALDHAAAKGHMEVVQLLAPIPISCGEDTVRTQYLSLALIESAKSGNGEVSEYLLSQGAEINFVGRHSGTPLYYASSTKDLGLVQFLLASGANPNLASTSGMVPLFGATNAEVLQALLEAGADIRARDYRGATVFTHHAETLLRFFNAVARPVLDPNYTVRPSHLSELQYFATKARSAKAAVQLILEFEAKKVDKADGSGRSPVEIAMERNRSFGEVVKTLVPLAWLAEIDNLELRSKIAAWWEAEEESEIEEWFYGLAVGKDL
ncbi:ankyrin repeat-containing domain protein [Mycena galopus ATCC 62051]|nr:ankyrin repeat-containing domain protein [Mycena galopus ATCC 62051]